MGSASGPARVFRTERRGSEHCSRTGKVWLSREKHQACSEPVRQPAGCFPQMWYRASPNYFLSCELLLGASQDREELGQVPWHPHASPSPPNPPGRASNSSKRKRDFMESDAMPRQLEMIVLRMLLDVILLSCLMTSVPRDVSLLVSCDTLIQY